MKEININGCVSCISENVWNELKRIYSNKNDKELIDCIKEHFMGVMDDNWNKQPIITDNMIISFISMYKDIEQGFKELNIHVDD